MNGVNGLSVFVEAERRTYSLLNRLSAHQMETVRIRNLRLITGAIVLATASLIASIWLLKIRSGGGGS